MSLKTCLKKIKKTFLYDFGRLVAQTPHEPIHVWKTHVPNAGLRRNFLTMSKTWVSFTRDNECTYFMTALTLSNIFQIIFWVIRGSCLWGSNFLDLSKKCLCLVENYPGDYCMMFTMPMVDAVPTWGKRTDSLLRYEIKYLFELKTTINAITVDIWLIFWTFCLFFIIVTLSKLKF